jgi:hypothetical protein
MRFRLSRGGIRMIKSVVLRSSIIYNNAAWRVGGGVMIIWGVGWKGGRNGRLGLGWFLER